VRNEPIHDMLDILRL